MTAIKRLGDVDRQATNNEFEGEIREFIRRDVTARRPAPRQRRLKPNRTT